VLVCAVSIVFVTGARCGWSRAAVGWLVLPCAHAPRRGQKASTTIR